MKTLLFLLVMLVLVMTFTSTPAVMAQEKPQADLDFTQISGEWKGRLGRGTSWFWLKINVLSGGQIDGKLVFRGEQEGFPPLGVEV